ncbi:MAG: hypothetical protein AAGA87_07345 [Pseudomonadota bacterium]
MHSLSVNKKECEAFLVEAGWTQREAGRDPVFEIAFSDRKLISLPIFKTLPQDQVVIWDHSQVWFEDYATVFHALLPTKELQFASLVSRKNSYFQADAHPDLNFVREMTLELKDWALSVDYDAEIKRLAEVKPYPGMIAFRHIAACVLAGKVDRLEAVRSDIAENGKTTDLHPRITLEIASRAIELAKSKFGAPCN